MKTKIQAVWYIDDDNVKHFTVITKEVELWFLRNRFDLVGFLEDFM